MQKTVFKTYTCLKASSEATEDFKRIREKMKGKIKAVNDAASGSGLTYGQYQASKYAEYQKRLSEFFDKNKWKSEPNPDTHFKTAVKKRIIKGYTFSYQEIYDETYNESCWQVSINRKKFTKFCGNRIKSEETAKRALFEKVNELRIV